MTHMDIRTTTTITLDPAEQVTYERDNVTFAVKVIMLHDGDVERPRILCVRVYRNGTRTGNALPRSFGELPAEAAEAVRAIIRAV